jgi:nucleoid DNA-binding protein
MRSEASELMADTLSGKSEKPKTTPSRIPVWDLPTVPVGGEIGAHLPLQPKETPMDSPTIKKPMTKTEMIAALAESTGLERKQVVCLFDELAKLIGKELGEAGPGTINISTLLKIKVVRKPATPERKGINPFTKEETVFKAKPATNAVKLVPLRGLKELA